ncbi:type II toxin-antitoxin system HicB family antitoxin [Endozoicomonas sp. 8E]|uniref:type II toxin-antitoxin system HicB family antitoxin n=1 Tax=Endozoicomonas sp. 8E TaxID=3035692 RepID=UPI002938DB82|nr:type II toxin-antitoxin system HicB family antitoxin [Endozoicomonas sp. 8E]WOG28895.1 type II toxin-antitoxin system HicB family antitoxin [Endozoicomonas sp. 8E]
MKYPVVLHTDDGESYGVMVPDIEGCFSAGNSIEEALANVKEAIEGHLEINMTLPVLLLRQIDKLVEADPSYRTRSGFLQEIARAKLRSIG